MSIVTFISSIKRILPEAEWPWVFSALSFDPLVWESLGGELGLRMLERKAERGEDFSPAALALLTLGLDASVEELRTSPLQEVQLGEISDSESLPGLAMAGLTALQLREASRSSSAWEVILRQSSRITPTALACAYSLLPDPSDLLRAAFALDLAEDLRPGVNPAVHALLANPLHPQAHVEALKELLSDLPRSERLTLLGQVHRYRPDLAPPLALAALNREPPVLGALPAGGLDRFNALGQIEKMLRAARLHRLADDPVQALSSLENATVTARRLQAELAAQSAQITAQKDGSEASVPAWEEATRLDPASPDHLAGLAFAMLDSGRIADAHALLAEHTFETPHAGILLAHARLAMLQDFKENARRAALEALDAGSAATSVPPAIAGPELSGLLLQLDEPADASRAAELALRQQPNDSRLLALLARSRLAACQPVQAVQAAHLAVALRPQSLELRRLLAECLEFSGEWASALQERSALLERTDSPSSEDLLELATCSFYAGHPEQAAKICRQLLERDEQDGLTWTLLGQSLAAQGEAEAALENLQRATQLSPESSAPWLALSKMYQEIGQKEKALETLQAAILSVPDLPEIQLALGEIYLAQGAATQALTCLRTAASLADELPAPATIGRAWSGQPFQEGLSRRLSDLIALRLGQTLHLLGHLSEAERTLVKVHQRVPSDAEIARSYVQVLLDLGQLRPALKPLKSLIQSGPEDSGPYLAYARTILTLHAQNEGELPLEDAIAAIHSAQAIDPANAEATALLAEALAAHDDLPEAMGAYRKALESNLVEEPAWVARLSLGLGEVAQKLGQIETAIVALQEASQVAPADARIQRTLSNAYDAAGLADNAYEAARSALRLAQSDVDNLSWFAGQALALKDRPGTNLPEAQAEACDALERATQHAPQRGDLWVKLAQLYLEQGDAEAALEALMNLSDPEGPAANSSTTDLYEASQGLLQLGEAGEAVRCLERALQHGADPITQVSPSLLEMLTTLSSARYQVGDLQAALEAMDQAIALNPDDPALHLEKANMLLELGYAEAQPQQAPVNTREALASLVTAMRLNPHDPELLQRAAVIHRAAGDLPTALAYADQMVELSVNVPQAMCARALAADLALSMLQPAQARAYLDGPLPPSDPAELVQDEVLLDYHALRAELALEAGDERGAVEELVRVLEIAPQDPRLLAIQARIVHKREDSQAAGDILENVIRSMGDPALVPLSLVRSAAQTAVEMSNWGVALQLYSQAIEAAPFEPRAHLDQARALTLRAEFTRLCQALDAVQHAAESEAFSEQTWHAIELSLSKADSLVSNWGMGSSEKGESGQSETPSNRWMNKWADPVAQIHRWRMRSQAAFHPSAEAAQALAALPPNSNDVAARVACLREVGDLAQAGLTARDYPQHPLVLLQLALALMNEKPRQAMAAIHAAADVLSQPSANQRHLSEISHKEITPLVHMLMARLFHNNGNRASDRESALQAILNALAYWSDEPHWHALAAEIYLAGDALEEQNDIEAAISHLEQAIKFDPGNTISLVALGQIYLREGSVQKAVQAFEQAVQAEPDEAEPWIWLARACRNLGDFEQAAAHAEHAVTLAPNQVEPLLLRGEIALLANNPRGAQSRAQAALRIQPDDPDALLLLARALNELDRPDEALATLDKAMPLAVEPLPLSIERVRLLRRAHGPDAALQAAQLLADHHPENPRILAVQAELLENAGQSEAAIQAAQRALRQTDRGAGLPDEEQARLHFLLGRLLRRSGQLDQAVHHLSETILLAPILVEAYLEMGHVHQERRQHNQAINAYRQAISVAPHDHRAYYLIGQALKESKDYIGAEKMLRRAADLAPNDVSIHRLLGAVVALNLVHNRRESARETSQVM